MSRATPSVTRGRERKGKRGDRVKRKIGNSLAPGRGTRQYERNERTRAVPEEKKHGEEGGGKFVTNSFVSSTPRKGATEEKTIPDCYSVVVHGERRRKRRNEVRGPFASAKPFLSAAVYAASARVTNRPRTHGQSNPCKPRACTCGRQHARARPRI